jgi:hypothetical protein
MLGHRLDDRKVVADRRAFDLASRFARASERPLPAQAQLQDFFVAPLDILSFRQAGQRRFQLLELNGTGIGGITNMPRALDENILDTIAEIAMARQDHRLRPTRSALWALSQLSLRLGHIPRTGCLRRRRKLLLVS